MFCRLVFFKQLYGEIACRVALAQGVNLFELLLYLRYAFLYIGAVVYVNVPEHVVSWLYAVGKIFLVVSCRFVGTCFLIFCVPSLYLLCHLRIEIAFVVKKVASLIEVYYNMEEKLNATSALEGCRNHGYTKELSELAIVDVVATLLCLVKHVECTDHAWVHVDELRGEVEVTLQIACVDDVYNDVRGLLYELLAHIKLFWRIGRERVGAGQVDEVKLITFKCGVAFFGVNGNA